MNFTVDFVKNRQNSYRFNSIVLSSNRDLRDLSMILKKAKKVEFRDFKEVH